MNSVDKKLYLEASSLLSNQDVFSWAIDRMSSARSLTEFGCGKGEFVNYLDSNLFTLKDYVGVDFPENSDFCKSRFTRNYKFISCEDTTAMSKLKVTDGVVSFGLLPFSNNIVSTLDFLATRCVEFLIFNYIRPGSVLDIYSVNRDYVYSCFNKCRHIEIEHLNNSNIDMVLVEF